jgi:hypothetical protein
MLITLSVRHFSETSLKQSVRELATEEGDSRQELQNETPAMKNFDSVRRSLPVSVFTS